jgi:flagellar assembly protein FliH
MADAPVFRQPRDAAPARVAAIEHEAQRREQQALEAGIRKGEEEARRRFTAEIQEISRRVARSLEDLMAARGRMRRRMEEDVVKLAVAIAKRILHRELSVDPEALAGVVKAALERVDLRDVDLLRAHPADAGMLQQALSELPLAGKIQVDGDPSLARGSLILETRRGFLDASVATQLEEIDRGFTDLLRQHHASG